jgi:hypothetical protein
MEADLVRLARQQGHFHPSRTAFTLLAAVPPATADPAMPLRPGTHRRRVPGDAHDSTRQSMTFASNAALEAGACGGAWPQIP